MVKKFIGSYFVFLAPPLSYKKKDRMEEDEKKEYSYEIKLVTTSYVKNIHITQDNLVDGFVKKEISEKYYLKNGDILLYKSSIMKEPTVMLFLESILFDEYKNSCFVPSHNFIIMRFNKEKFLEDFDVKEIDDNFFEGLVHFVKRSLKNIDDDVRISINLLENIELNTENINSIDSLLAYFDLLLSFEIERKLANLQIEYTDLEIDKIIRPEKKEKKMNDICIKIYCFSEAIKILSKSGLIKNYDEYEELNEFLNSDSYIENFESKYEYEEFKNEINFIVTEYIRQMDMSRYSLYKLFFEIHFPDPFLRDISHLYNIINKIDRKNIKMVMDYSFISIRIMHELIIKNKVKYFSFGNYSISRYKSEDEQLFKFISLLVNLKCESNTYNVYLSNSLIFEQNKNYDMYIFNMRFLVNLSRTQRVNKLYDSLHIEKIYDLKTEKTFIFSNKKDEEYSFNIYKIGFKDEIVEYKIEYKAFKENNYSLEIGKYLDTEMLLNNVDIELYKIREKNRELLKKLKK